MATIAERLESVWGEGQGLAAWVGTVDHKRIGMRYLYTGFAFFIAAGLEAMLLRVQLAAPDLRVLNPEAYNQLFSMHGVTMMFLFATPVLSGFGNYFVPLMIGARDMAFPRLNAFGYWVFLAAATLPNTRADLERWIADPQSVKPGAVMPPTQLSAEDLQALVDFLEGLR